jgi:hypothetical protein
MFPPCYHSTNKINNNSKERDTSEMVRVFSYFFLSHSAFLILCTC